MVFRRLGTALPAAYHFSHEYCFALHDELVGYLHGMNEHRLRMVTLTFREPSHEAAIAGFDAEQLMEWMAANGYEQELGDLLVKQLLYALMGDSCHFLYEALRCSEKGKLTVTYSLLRKPLRDNLLQLEHLLARPEYFVNAFWSEPPKALSLESLRDRGELLAIITEAAARTSWHGVHDPQYLYELRYERSLPFSLEALWHKALHLITTTRHVATEPRNINFIFSDIQSIEQQWDHIYSTLPTLLCYMTDVCTSLMLLAGGEQLVSAEALLRRKLGLILCGTDPQRYAARGEAEPTSLSTLVFPCKWCGADLCQQWAPLRALYEVGKVQCPKCDRYTRLEDFLESVPSEDDEGRGSAANENA